MCKNLLDYGANIFQLNDIGWNSLQSARKCKKIECENILTEYIKLKYCLPIIRYLNEKITNDCAEKVISYLIYKKIE